LDASCGRNIYMIKEMHILYVNHDFKL
jgi:hypothetical protein